MSIELCPEMQIRSKISLKVYIFELADLSAFQKCKNEIHTMLVSKAHFFHLRFSSLLLRFLKTKTNAEYCASEYLSNGTKFIMIEKFLEKLLTKEKRLHAYPE